MFRNIALLTHFLRQRLLIFSHDWIPDEICGNSDEMLTSEECGGETPPPSRRLYIQLTFRRQQNMSSYNTLLQGFSFSKILKIILKIHQNFSKIFFELRHILSRYFYLIVRIQRFGSKTRWTKEKLRSPTKMSRGKNMDLF